MYGRILASQTNEQDGAYTRAMNGGTNQRLTFTTNMATACTAVTGGARTFSFTASANISNFCNVSASTLNFGSHLNLTANRDQTSTIQAQCTNSTPYNIGLDVGTGAGATVATRKMTSGGTTINYSLYRNTTRTQVWGTTIGTNTVSATGNGTTQNHTVYGRVPVQTTPNPATYSDTITATVTY
jgi:spore coat protein U-like protein